MMMTKLFLNILPFAMEPSAWMLLGEERKGGLLTSRRCVPGGCWGWGQKDISDLGKGKEGRVFLSLPPFSVPSTGSG